MMKLPNCPACPDVELVQEGTTLRCTKCRQRYSMPQQSMTANDSIGGESDPSMDETIDTPAAAHKGHAPGEVPQAQGEALKLPFSEAFMQVYEPVSFLGKGAMGQVYLMRQVKLDRLVAVKVVNADAMTAEVTRRLVQEAKVLASLNHVNIMGIFDVGEDNGLPYMVNEYVEGEPLNERLRREPPLTLAQNLRIILHVLDGLRAAHKQSIVHRDLKPSNVFLTSTGKPKIGDFGLAKSQNAPSGTAVGRILGTPGYMSPEQCRGRAVTAASDIYAVGILLFELVCGRRPFQGPQLLDYLRQHTTEQPPRMRDVLPSVPASLDAVFQKAVQKDPNDRFKSATEFKKTLQEIYRQISPSKDGGTQSQVSRTFNAVATGADLIPGAKLADRYELVKILGHGGMGQVWMAKDEIRQGVKVAVKLLPPELWRDPEARANLVGEANIALQLSHPDIVRLINIEPGESPFLVMELVLGPTLSEELSRRKKLGYGPMKPYETLVVMEAISRALDYAHDRNVIHRDIKPSNLILTLQDDHIVGAKLADFGIAAELANFKTRVTGAVPAGTLSYMSPEQVTCQKLDRRADVYSLGATLFQMLTGHPPYQGDEIAGAIKTAPVPDPEGVSLAVSTVVKASLAKRPEDRPSTAGELFQRLREAVGEGPGGQRSTQKSVAAHRGGETQDLSIGEASGSQSSMQASLTSPTKADGFADKSAELSQSGDGRAPWQPGVSDCGNAQESLIREAYPMTVNTQLPAGGLDALLGKGQGKSKTGAIVGGLLVVVLIGIGVSWPQINALINPKPSPTATEAPPTIEPTHAPTTTPVATRTASVAAPVAPALVTIDVNEPALKVETIEGHHAGLTGVPFSLHAGKHVLIIRSQNFEDAKVEFEVSPGDKKTFRPVLQRRTVAVKVTTVPPGAELFVDDQSRGKVGEVTILAGRPARISASLPGYKVATEKITVNANQEKDTTMVLQPEDVEVKIESTPAGAQILNPAGVAMGVTPRSFKLQPGQALQYSLALTGYESGTVNGTTMVGQPLLLSATLKKLPEVAPSPAGPTRIEVQRDDLLKRAEVLLSEKKYAQGEIVMLEALAIDPKHIDTHKMLSVMYMGQEDYERAVEWIEKAYNLQPDRLDLLDTYASAVLRASSAEKDDKAARNLLDKSEQLARKLVEKAGTNPSYLATLAQVLCYAGKASEGKQLIDKAMKLKPDVATRSALKELMSSCGK